MLGVVALVAANQLGHERPILGSGSWAADARRRADRMRNDEALRRESVGARAALDEDNNGPQNVGRRADVTLMDA